MLAIATQSLNLEVSRSSPTATPTIPEAECSTSDDLTPLTAPCYKLSDSTTAAPRSPACPTTAMAAPPPFEPIVCVVGFHHARYGTKLDRASITAANGNTEDRRWRDGLALKMAPIPSKRTNGHFYHSWPCRMAHIRKLELLARFCCCSQLVVP